MGKSVEKFAWGYVAFVGMLAFHVIVVRPLAVKMNVPLLKSL